MSFSADVDTRAYMHAMRILGREVLPEVIADALNETADAVTKRSLRYLQRRLTVRTKYTTNSLTRSGARPYRALNKARGRNIQRMYSRAGSISPYLGVQDTGGTERPERGSRVPIPTLNARTGKNIKKSIASRYNLGRMGDIAGDGRYFIGVPKGNQGPLGLYERYQGNKRLRMLRNLESAQVTIPASRWHRDAADEMGNQRFIRARFRRRARQRLQRMSKRAR
jgi:hypothetical protein